MKTIPCLRSCLLALLVFGFSTLVRAEESYRFQKEIPIGGDGGWDYLTVEPTAHRLYVTHATKIVVIDTEKDAVVGEIAGTSGVHGFAAVPKLGHGFASNGKAATVSIVDLATLQTLGEGRDRREPRRHPLRTGTRRSLCVQRPQPLRHRV